MQVFEVMTPDVIVIEADTPLAEAARKMKLLDVGPLPVVESDRLVGMVTDRDITVRATAEGLDPEKVQIREVMTPEVVACRDTDDIADAARTMQLAQLRRLVVVDQQGRLVGIVSLGDIALQAGDDKLTGETLEGVSEPGDKPIS
jgi:CBS domain-containing protein